MKLGDNTKSKQKIKGGAKKYFAVRSLRQFLM